MVNRLLPASTLILVAIILLPAGGAHAQPAPQPAPAAPPQPAPATPRPRQAMTSLEVQVVISRYQGQKQISSLPYLLAVTANAAVEAQLNMGADVPVPSTTFTPAAQGAPAGGAKEPPPTSRPVTSFSYRSVGTVIVCRAAGGEDGRYEVTLSVDDSSVVTSEQASPPIKLPDAVPVFRSFKTRNSLLLQDGQSRRFTAAADRVSGETVQVEVTLRVVK